MFQHLGDTLRRQMRWTDFLRDGLPYWTSDIGAFFVRNDPNLWFWKGGYDQGIEDMGYRELYGRWFQLWRIPADVSYARGRMRHVKSAFR